MSMLVVVVVVFTVLVLVLVFVPIHRIQPNPTQPNPTQPNPLISLALALSRPIFPYCRYGILVKDSCFDEDSTSGFPFCETV